MWSPLWSILVCKIPQFWAKATALDSPSYSSRVTKTLYYVLSTEGCQKKVSAYGLLQAFLECQISKDKPTALLAIKMWNFILI